MADGLCAKHDLQLADFTPHMELLMLEEETEEEETPQNGDVCVCACSHHTVGYITIATMGCVFLLLQVVGVSYSLV